MKVISIDENGDPYIECKSDEGIVIGLVDSIITTCRVMFTMHDFSDEIYDHPGVVSAFKDLHSDGS